MQSLQATETSLWVQQFAYVIPILSNNALNLVIPILSNNALNLVRERQDKFSWRIGSK